MPMWQHFATSDPRVTSGVLAPTMGCGSMCKGHTSTQHVSHTPAPQVHMCGCIGCYVHLTYAHAAMPLRLPRQPGEGMVQCGRPDTHACAPHNTVAIMCIHVCMQARHILCSHRYTRTPPLPMPCGTCTVHVWWGMGWCTARAGCMLAAPHVSEICTTYTHH